MSSIKILSTYLELQTKMQVLKTFFSDLIGMKLLDNANI
jgi:hypothetical protein